MTSKIAFFAALTVLAAAGPALAQRGMPAGPPGVRTMFPDLTTGESIYKEICQACHMPDAKGAVGAGAYPALANNERIGTAAYPVMVLLAGQKAMPAFGDIMSDTQIAGVVDYIRSHFGNTYKDKTTPAEVSEIRKSLAP